MKHVSLFMLDTPFREPHNFSIQQSIDSPNLNDGTTSFTPISAAGVYVVWREGQLIYAGMSGRNIEKQQHRKKYGLVTRLESHAKGRLSGDQFNAYKNQSGEVKN